MAPNRTALACGVIGFFAGALAWHLVGFWGFISAVAFNGDVRDAPIPAIVQRALTPPAGQSDVVTGSIAPRETKSEAVKTGKGCVALSIDRANGGIVQAPCETSAAEPLRDAGRQQRSDRAADLGARAESAEVWTSATATDAASAEPATTAVDDAAFDLQLRPGP